MHLLNPSYREFPIYRNIRHYHRPHLWYQGLDHHQYQRLASGQQLLKAQNGLTLDQRRQHNNNTLHRSLNQNVCASSFQQGHRTTSETPGLFPSCRIFHNGPIHSQSMGSRPHTLLEHANKY